MPPRDSEPPDMKGLDGPAQAAALYRAQAEGILALGLATTEADLFQVLLARCRAIYPMGHWAIGEMVDPAAELKEVVIRAESDGLPAWFGGSVLGKRFPVMGRGFSVRVYQEQRPAFAGEATEHPEIIHPDFTARFHVRSLLGIPLLFDGQSVGAIFAAAFQGEEPLPEAPEIFEALMTLARVAALALHRLRAQGALQAQLERANHLNAQVEASERRYRQLFEQSIEPVLIGNRSGYLMANEAAQALLGRRLEDLVGRPAGFFSPPFQPDGHSSIVAGRARIAEALEGRTVRFEWVVERPDGTRLDTEATVALIPSEGEPLFQVILRDLTEIKKAREERASLERQLFHAQKLESLGVLAGGIAHDFNNLLMGVMGHAGLALDMEDPPSQVRVHLEAIQTAGQRAADLTRQLLAYSGRGKFLIEPLELSRLVEELLPLVEVTIPKRVTLDLRLGQGLPVVMADHAQMQQVVLNLLLNAAEAMGEGGGRIAVTTAVQTVSTRDLPRLVEHQGLEPGECLVLEVADTGPGMDEATLHRIFEPFFTTKFTGRGLGLSAILGIVRGHHGGLEVVSAVGQGTVFRVYLPAGLPVQPESIDPPPPLPPMTSVACGMLVVDDDEAVRAVAAEILQSRAFHVATAADGVEALERLEAADGAIRLVLLDMTMPRMGGVEVLGHIRKRWPSVRVILSSGYSEEEVEKGLHGLHPDAFLQKPYRPKALLALVDQLLEA